ncbi:MAG TPA: penicillin-binding transpeptidase domain-containing protein [Bryobacteraceae bacterium]|nr:penicillin-binding transpeptidase domain-containing protein [Bryobacteraceae bacterium]
MHSFKISLALVLMALMGLSGPAFGLTPTKKKRSRRHVAASTTQAAHLVQASYTIPSVNRLSRLPKKKSVFSPWNVPTFADSTAGDSVDGEDLAVRRAAVQALGPYNGSVVVVDPKTGRILTIVNQKLAFQSGFEPCSTIKIVAALAGLSEGILTEENHFRLISRRSMDLTEALAHSNNAFFASVGVKLGFDRIVRYDEMFGLGEKAGLNIDGEQPGTLATEPPKDGLGMMTSFGEGVFMTPLELAGIVSAVANGGTLYYLQHPRSLQEVEQFSPRVKRQLDIAKWLPDIKPGMMGAVEYGTARRAGFNPSEPIFGKTGTCTDARSPTHLGWFGSYNETGENKLVVVVLLTGGRPVSGPVASGVAGAVYKNLAQENYFAKVRPGTPMALVSTQACCALP